MLTYIQHPIGILSARRHGNEMRPRDEGGPNARPQLLVGRRHTSPLHAIYPDKIREQPETNHPGERDSGKRPRGGGTIDNACPPPQTGRHHPSPITKTCQEDAINSTALDTSSDPTNYCQNPATHGNPHHMHTLLKTPPLNGTQTLTIVPLLSLNTDTPWQLTAGRSCPPHSFPGAVHHDTL